MLGSLPKIIERGFILGFLLPSVLFSIYAQGLAIDLPALDSFSKHVDALKLAPVLFIALILAILLMAVNRFIIRSLEGYGYLNPLRLLKPVRRFHFRRRAAPLFAEASRVEAARRNGQHERPTIPDFPQKLSQAIGIYPDREDLVLPTKFGNVMRAFEVHSRVVYGLDAIPAWPRLFLVLPKVIKDQIRDSRAMLDFNANLLCLSLLAIALTLAQAYVSQSAEKVFYLVPFPLAAGIYAWVALPQGAQQWGEIVKSAFDLYRQRLAKEMGLTVPAKAVDERRMWHQVSRLIIFRSDAALELLDEFRQPKAPRQKRARRSEGLGTDPSKGIPVGGPPSEST